jgi:hypothetical protein
MKRLAVLLIGLMLTSITSAQVRLTEQVTQTWDGFESARVENGKVLAGPLSKPVLTSTDSKIVVVYEVPFKFSYIEAEKIPTLETVALEEVPGGYWFPANSPPGKYRVTLICSDPENGLAIKKLTVVVGGVPPKPDPDNPEPPVPTSCDAKANTNFDGLAKRACGWVAEVVPENMRSKRTEIAKAYLNTSKKLDSGEYLTINMASASFASEWNKILATTEQKQAWAGWSAKANEELSKHWNNQTTNTDKRALMVRFFESLGQGLE